MHSVPRYAGATGRLIGIGFKVLARRCAVVFLGAVTNWRRLSLRFGVVLILSVVSLREFIFGSGFYEYSDQLWPIGSGALPADFFTPSPISPNGQQIVVQFPRDLVTWPGWVFWSTGHDQVFSEKIFIFYSFVLFLVLAYCVASLIAKILHERFGITLAGNRRELFLLAFVVGAFLNPYSLDQNVNGGTWTISLIVLLLIVVFLLLLTRHPPVTTGVITGAIASITVFLDPDFFAIVLLTAVVAVLLRVVATRNFLGGVSRIFGFLSASLPAAVFAFYTVNPAFATSSASQQSVRAFSLAGAVGSSYNLSLTSVLRLFGYSWSTLAFGPPNVALNSAISQLPGAGSPTQFLLPPGAETAVWVACTFALPIAAIASLVFVRTRRLAIASTLLLFAGIVGTQYAFILPLAEAAVGLSELPLVGGAISATLALPEIFLSLVTAATLLGFSLTIANLLRDPRPGDSMKPSPIETDNRWVTARGQSRLGVRWKRRLSRGSGSGRIIIAVAILVFVVIAGWQAINGSYYPSRAYPGYVAGNGVPDSAPYGPVAPPPGVQYIYDYLFKLPGEFNIYWPTWGANASDAAHAVHFFDVSEAPKPMASLPAFPNLISQGLLGDTVAYLQAENVRFVVAQNTTTSALNEFYGSTSFESLVKSLNATAGIRESYCTVGICLFDVTGTLGVSYPVQLVLNPLSASPTYAYSYALLGSLGITPSLTTDTATAFSFGVGGAEGVVSMLPPSTLSEISPDRIASLLPVAGQNYTTSIPGGIGYRFNQSGSWNLAQGSLALGNWSLTNWGPAEVNISAANGSLSITSSGSALFTLSIGNLLTFGPGGIQIFNPGSRSEEIGLSGMYSVESPSEAKVSSSIVSDNGTGIGLPQFETDHPSTRNLSVLNYSAPAPPYTRYFSPWLQIVLNATEVKFQNLTAIWGVSSFDSSVVADTGNLPILNWTITNWGSNPVQVNMNPALLSLQSGEATNLSLNYGPVLTNGPGGIRIPAGNSTIVAATLCSDVQGSPSTTGILRAYATYLYDESIPGVSASTYLNFSGQASSACASFAVPSGAGYFSVRLEADALVGSLSIRNLSLSWSLLGMNSSLPFGQEFRPDLSTLTLPFRGRSVYLELDGGALSGADLVRRVPLSNLTWWEAAGAATIGVSSDAAITATLLFPLAGYQGLLTNSTAYSVTFLPTTTLIQSGRQFVGVATIDGETLFLAPFASGQPNVEVGFVVPVEVSYSTLVFLDVSILLIWFVRPGWGRAAKAHPKWLARRNRR
jgi:hypothetical protein